MEQKSFLRPWFGEDPLEITDKSVRGEVNAENTVGLCEMACKL